jgi:regulator of protease activity HflC (stomatin/prohibitin superfamily)
VSNTEA